MDTASKPTPPSAPIGMIAVLAVAALLYALMLAWIGDARDSDAAGRGLAGFYILVGGFLLWVALAILLMIGAVRGRMPLGATLAAVVLLPASAVAVVKAINLYDHNVDWLILVPALLPPIFALYALWARLPVLQARFKPAATSAVAGIAIGALTALPFAVQAWEDRPNPERDARLAAEAQERQAAEDKRIREEREQEAAAFAKLGPDSSLMDYLPFLQTNHRDEAMAGVKKVKSRQADTIALLQKKGLDGTPNLLLLDLQPTPEVCQAYGTALASAATQISPRLRSDYVTAAIQLEYEVSTIQWLTGHDCNLNESLTLAATNVRAASDSDRLKKFADKLESLRTAK
jgi:hypothetical protein